MGKKTQKSEVNKLIYNQNPLDMNTLQIVLLLATIGMVMMGAVPTVDSGYDVRRGGGRGGDPTGVPRLEDALKLLGSILFNPFHPGPVIPEFNVTTTTAPAT